MTHPVTSTATPRVVGWLDALQRDVRYAVRVLVRTPSFTVAAVASLALGIAVNTTMFSVIDSLLLDPLGAGGDALVRIGRSAPGERDFRSVTLEELVYLREHASSFSDIAGHQIEGLTTTAGDRAEPISAELVAGSYFGLLGAAPRLGRPFGPQEDRPDGRTAVAIISDRFWRRRFASDPAVLGGTIPIDGHPFTIVGVAPPGFTGTFPGVDVDLWVPTGAASLTRPDGNARTETSLFLIGRLRDGVSRERAEAELRGLAQRMAQDDRREPERTFVVGGARGAHPVVANALRVFLLMLMATVGVVLLIACANVAGLLLARASARSGEVAVRLAIGASRGQVIAQMMVESLLLAVLSGIAGVLLSIWPIALLNDLSLMPGPTGARIFLGVKVDRTVLAFTAAASLLTAVVFGVAPAVQATRISLSARLKDSHGVVGRTRSRLRSALIVVQVCASVVLLVPAALLFRSLRNVERVNVGFDPDRVLVASVDLRSVSFDAARAAAFHTELLARARALPGVEAAALAGFVPMGDGRGHPLPLRVGSGKPEAEERPLTVSVGRVSDGYFRTLGQPLLRGRDFAGQDRSGAHAVAIVNEAMVRRHWADGGALGERIGLGEDLREHEIVGVVADARFATFGDDVQPLVYLPAFDAGRLHLRTRLTPSEVLPSVRRLVEEMDASVLPYMEGRPMRDIMASSPSLIPVRIARVVFAVAGVIALLLAAGGLYALVSYTLERRLKEIGIRVAMGANRRRVFAVIVGSAMRLAAVGLAAGIVLAAGVMRVLRSFVYGLSPTDPVTFAGIGVLLALVALAAGYTAARRGLDADPMVLLRHE